MSRYFMHLCYKGTNYCGWQIQPDSPTVQKTIENCISTLLKNDISLTGCGRTDTGVHARNFYAHFDTELPPHLTNDKFTYKLNCLLPPDIKVFRVFPAKSNAHSRFDASCRHYKYYISQTKEIFQADYVWQLFKPLDIDRMNLAAKELLNYTDFTSFSKLHTNVKTNNCKIVHASWSFENSMMVFSIGADRFLRNMVRAIVGTLVEVGKKKISVNEFCTIIESKNRTEAGASVPAKGLFLEDVDYPYRMY